MTRTNKYAALFDVLGFRELIARDHDGKELQAYLKCLEVAIPKKEGSESIEYVIFSDSIILTTADDSEQSLLRLVQSSSHLFSLLLENEIAVRGAISHGMLVREVGPSGTFVAGRPIVEAYDFEGRQDWVGIVLCPSVVRSNSELKLRKIMDSDTWMGKPKDEQHLKWMLCVQHWSQIQFHSEQPMALNSWDGFAVIPSEGQAATLDNIDRSLANSIQKLEWLRSLAPDPKSQNKYTRTHDWLDGTVKLFFQNYKDNAHRMASFSGA
jgi:hypothetical protein